MIAHPPLRVLLADSDADFVRLFTRRMGEIASWAVTVDVCPSGSDLTQRLYAQPYDLIFMDLGFTDINSLELLERMELTSLPMPVVALARDDRSRPAVEAMKHGVLDHIMKDDFAGMDIDGFLGRLTQMFRLKRENAELRQISEMKNDFLATISHELRTPLTSILGLSELVVAGRMGPVNEKQSDALRKVIDQSQNLSRLINQLLEVQDTLQSGPRAEGRLMDFAQFVVERTQCLRPLFDNKGIRLSVDPGGAPLWVRFHAETMTKVYDHLLLNALKFTPAGGDTSVRMTQGAGGQAAVSIQDSGQGIPKEALPFVFQKFFHADPSLTRPYGGLGLGLAYCQHVVESMGGRIWVESPGVGKGTTVSFMVPLAPSEAAPPPADHQRVLWVDDNENMLELMEVGFASLPETVQLVTCQTGREALEEARTHPPHLIVLDIMMPDMNGLEVLARLKADPLTRSIPVMMVTGYREAAEEAVSHGADSFFLKPFRIPDILSKVREHLNLPPLAHR